MSTVPQTSSRSLDRSGRSTGGKVRVLLACTGWPSGILDVGSWAHRSGLAEVSILQMQPDCPDGWLETDGPLTGAVREAVAAVGGAMVRKLIDFRPHVVGFRLEGGGLSDLRKFIAAVRLLSDAEIVVGGPTATSHPREVLEECGADYVFAGEAEESFLEFLRLGWAPNSRDRAAEIPGLTFSYGGHIYHNTLPFDGYQQTALDVDHELYGPRRANARNLLRPVVEQELLSANRLDWSLLENFQREFESLFFIGGRGCPGECTFCARLHGQQVRVKEAGQLLDEIAHADANVRAGKIKVSRWRLYQYVDDPALRDRLVSWAAIYDEDFFLHRRRAIEFFTLWDRSPLHERYRLSVQTNPCSLLAAKGQFHPELWHWIDRLKPMIQLGAESFHDALLHRWRKRHKLAELETVITDLDRTRQDYTVFQILTDFESTPAEFLESLRLLVRAAFRHRRMRIASGPYTIALYDSDTRKALELGGRIPHQPAVHFTDYECPQPRWMDPLTAELADLADAELHFSLMPEHRDAALVQAFEVVASRVRQEEQRIVGDSSAPAMARWRIVELANQARHALDEIRDAQFDAPLRKHG